MFGPFGSSFSEGRGVYGLCNLGSNAANHFDCGNGSGLTSEQDKKKVTAPIGLRAVTSCN